MKQVEENIDRSPLSDLRNSIEVLISEYTHRCSEVYETLSRPGASAEREGKIMQGGPAQEEFSENQFSLLYTLNGQYQHVGCSSQEEAQSVMASMMTDEMRIPIGIYDAKTDIFEWEMIGQYFHSQDPIEDQRARQNEIMTVVRAIRRRDSSWEPGVLQRPGLFA